MQASYDAVAALTDAFCRDRLTDEYRNLARAMAAALARKRAGPLLSGPPRTWACGIIRLLGRVNFLSDKASQPHMAMAEVAAAFGVGQSTASAKARVISDALHTNRDRNLRTGGSRCREVETLFLGVAQGCTHVASG